MQCEITVINTKFPFHFKLPNTIAISMSVTHTLSYWILVCMQCAHQVPGASFLGRTLTMSDGTRNGDSPIPLYYCQQMDTIMVRTAHTWLSMNPPTGFCHVLLHLLEISEHTPQLPASTCLYSSELPSQWAARYRTVLQCMVSIITCNSNTLDVHCHHNKGKTDYIKPFNFLYKVNAMICNNVC